MFSPRSYPIASHLLLEKDCQLLSSCPNRRVLPSRVCRSLSAPRSWGLAFRSTRPPTGLSIALGPFMQRTMAKGLTETQLENISDIERACSVLSLLGSSFIIATFCLSNAFHKPINRLVFYASFGNAMTNIGTLMSRNYIAASNSVGCQFQAFLIQMYGFKSGESRSDADEVIYRFMPADAFWTLAMAINVWLTFYCTFDAQRIRKLEILYLLCCYGIPLVPALVYIFVKSNGQRVYGNATLWCWVSPAWGVWRVATFYGPIWWVAGGCS